MERECNEQEGPFAYSNEPEWSIEEQKVRLQKWEARKLSLAKQQASPSQASSSKKTRAKKTDWCHCNNCVAMKTEVESICCMKINDSYTKIRSDRQYALPTMIISVLLL